MVYIHESPPPKPTTLNPNHTLLNTKSTLKGGIHVVYSECGLGLVSVEGFCRVQQLVQQLFM